MSSASLAPVFTLADPARDRQALIDLNVEYMNWNDVEIRKRCGFSVVDVLGQPIPDYISGAVDKVCGEAPPRGAFYLVSLGGECVGMGGMRFVRPGAAEIKRLYVRPAFQGRRLGLAIFERLMADATAFGYQTVLLDSGGFMHSAHRLYEAAGFTDCEPYPEAEVPKALHPHWRFMHRSL